MIPECRVFHLNGFCVMSFGTSAELPFGADVLGPLPDLDYFDSQTVTLAREISPIEAWNIMTVRRQPLLDLSFKIRDLVSGLFGVQPIGGFSKTRHTQAPAVGKMLDFFTVENATDQVLSLASRDRHLDVLTSLSVHGKTLSVTSSVQTHNWFGDAYMLPVGVAHKVIVRNMLSRVRNELAREMAA